MTNWTTAAGLTLITGGFATLISFRSVLFGSGRREDREMAAPTTPEPKPKPAQPILHFEPARAVPIQVVLSWPPINEVRRPELWSTRNVNSRAPWAVFPGRPGDRPTVLENRPRPHPRILYVGRHAADPPS